MSYDKSTEIWPADYIHTTGKELSIQYSARWKSHWRQCLCWNTDMGSKHTLGITKDHTGIVTSIYYHIWEGPSNNVARICDSTNFQEVPRVMNNSCSWLALRLSSVITGTPRVETISTSHMRAYIQTEIHSLSYFLSKTRYRSYCNNRKTILKIKITKDFKPSKYW